MRNLWLKTGVIAVISGAVLLTSCTESMQREIKSMSSEYLGGLERTARVYAGSGEMIAEYQGKFDVQSSEYGNKVLFDIDGKRVIIYNATVIVEEQ